MPFNGKNILVTGGTGSFGNKFAEIVLRDFTPNKLIIFSRDELKQHEMRQRFPDHSGSPVRYFIGDVRSRERLERAFQGVDIVVHAAALKQVPACEYNPFEAIQTNVIGGKNVIDAALDKKVSKVMFISTDKAVNPINLYGATKLCAEKMAIQANAYATQSGTRVSACRYGNVVGSRGSVIPVFTKQRKTGRITITDDRMTRFWLTLEQGVKFVIDSIERMVGGEIFIPKIPSMNIMDLAKAIAPDCDIDTIGIRPGEKLHEALISIDEARTARDLGDAYAVLPAHPWWSDECVRGDVLPEGFSYTSDNNDQWLDVAGLQKLIK